MFHNVMHKRTNAPLAALDRFLKSVFECLIDEGRHFQRDQAIDVAHSLGGCDPVVYIRTGSCGCTVVCRNFRLHRTSWFRLGLNGIAILGVICVGVEQLHPRVWRNRRAVFNVLTRCSEQRLIWRSGCVHNPFRIAGRVYNVRPQAR